jgi:large repetitive protein
MAYIPGHHTMTNRKGAFARMAALAVVISMVLTRIATSGTVGLLKDLAADEVIAGTDPWYLGVTGQIAVFAGNVPGEQGRALFRTDGTANGTVRFNVANTVDPSRFMTLGNRVLFVAYDSHGHGQARLWSTDGTDAGTTMIRALGSGDWTAAPLGNASGGRRYFCATGGPFQSCELYITDGTAAGTVRLAPDRFVGTSLADAAGNLYFMSNDTTGGAPALWVSDGTTAGTRPLHSLDALGFQAFGPIAWVDSQNLYVNGQVPNNIRGLYRVSIASGAVTQLAPNGFSTFAQNPVELNGAHVFLMDDHLWSSDGTPAGTIDLGPALTPPVTHPQLARVGNRVLFLRFTPTTGNELWSTDGTLAGTQILLDATPGADGYAELLAATSDRVFFAAGPSGALRFWVTDGTSAGTRVIPVRGGTPSFQGVSYWTTGAVAGSRVYLQATVHASMSGNVGPRERLWVTDTAGTDVLDLNFAGTQLEVAGERVFFANLSDALGTEPWISDGTVAGTTRILDLAVTGQTDASSPTVFTRLGTQVFFGAQDRDHGRELWVTDGTSANTRRLTDINAGPGHSMPLDSRLEAANGLLYFLATPTFSPDDYRLWRSDGTESGTFSLGDIGAHSLGCGRWTAEYAGRVWFFGHTPPGTLASLWSTDGTAAGTRHELDLPLEIQHLPMCNLQVSANGIVFTVGYPFNGASLWRTDGTVAGTFQLGSVVPASAGPGPLTAQHSALSAGIVYLLADDGVAGRELWRTDGTQAGTVRIADLTAGPEGAQLFAIEPFGAGVVFEYSSAPATADGLWRIAQPNAAPERIKAGDVWGPLPVVGSRVFFTFEDAGTQSLWVSDGTAAGSREVFNPGAGSSLPINQMFAGDQYLFFSGPLDASGEQVWFTNGQPNGLHKLSNFPTNTFLPNAPWAVLNDRPIFSFDDRTHGAEPYIVVNQPPVAVADAVTTTRGASVLVNVRANDTDPDSAAAIITLSVVAQPANGTLAAEGAGFRYTPNASFTGSDSFEYQATDEFGARSGVARVTVTVIAPPAAGGGSGGKKGGGAIEWPMVVLLLGACLARRRVSALAG